MSFLPLKKVGSNIPESSIDLSPYSFQFAVFLQGRDKTIQMNGDGLQSPLLSNEQPSDANQLEANALFVNNLSYIPSRTLGNVVSSKILSIFPSWDFPCWQRLTTDYMRPMLKPSTESRSSVSPLRSITFAARQGKITSIISSDYGERRTLIDLIVGRRKRGVYSGDITLHGPNLHVNTTMSMNSAFVPKKCLFTPGITYEKFLHYAARLRMSINPDGSYNNNISDDDITKRVNEVLKLMNLWKVRSDTLPEETIQRGDEAGALRRLSIAVEIVHYPPLVIVDDPIAGLEPAVAYTIMQTLRQFALHGNGHIVLLAMPEPTPAILSMIDHLVVIGNGYTIYSSPPQDLRSFFCSDNIGYELQKGIDLIHWVRDIATGVERPSNHRGPINSALLQEQFESSDFFKDKEYFNSTKILMNGSNNVNQNQVISAFNSKLFQYWGYGQFNDWKVHLHQIYVITSRALHAKTYEKETLKSSFGGSILVGLLIGSLNYGLGSYGYYTMMLLNFPYVNTSNITAVMFFIGAFIFTQQVLTVQIICRKVSLFRQEQSAGYCGMGTFALATILSEAPVSCAMSLLFGYIVYFMTSLNLGINNFEFYTLNIMSIATIGLQTTLLLAVLLRREILVRDIYILIVFLQVMLSGYPFQLNAITPFFKTISEINPMRWSFASLMAFKFGQNYFDGEAYITPFACQNFEWYHALGYYQTMLFVGFSLTLLLLFSKPNFLRSKDNDSMYKSRTSNAGAGAGASNTDENSNRVMAFFVSIFSCCGLCGSVDDRNSRGRASSLDPVERSMWLSDADAGMDAAERRGDKTGSRSGSLSEAVGVGGGVNTSINNNKNSSKAREAPNFQRIRTAELARPLLYLRESSVTGGQNSRLSAQISADGTKNEFARGPTVAFRHITHKVADRRSFSGYNHTLDNVSGQFDWGKLSCVMGSQGSGKSTLLRVLAGDIAPRSNTTGHITYDQVTPDINTPLWRRCALVGTNDAQHPALTVQEVITYSMQLRILSTEGLQHVEENVEKTMDILHLSDLRNKQVQKLNAGERRRLSIAEEIVCGPSLLFIDEPTTNLDPLAESIVLRTFREMVNESRTVVVTLHQPSAVVFDLFDTLLLLSKGQVIYHGPTSEAVKYFVQKPLNFPYNDYNNPSDYLVDISGEFLTDIKKNKVNCFTLAKEWKKSEKYSLLIRKLNPQMFRQLRDEQNAAKKRLSSNMNKSGYGKNSNLPRRTTSETTEATDGGDEFDMQIDDLLDVDTDSGRLTFSRSTNSFGGLPKHASALEQASAMGMGVPLNDGVSSGATIQQINSNHNQSNNPLLKSNSATTMSSSAIGSGGGDYDVDDISTLENKRKQEMDNIQMRTPFDEIWGLLCDLFCSMWYICYHGTMNFIFESEFRNIILYKIYIVLKRSAIGLFKRWPLFFGNIFTMIGIATLLGLIMGDSSTSLYNTTSFFAVSALLIMLSNIQLISYLFTTHQVFYKDHSRGVYNNFTYWLVSSLPLYLLRCFGAYFFALISYNMLNLQSPTPTPTVSNDETTDTDDTKTFFIFMTIATTIASTMVVEFVIYIAPTIRAAYLMSPAISFLQFQFSGLFLKPTLLPYWLQPWAPSVSLFRWTLQGSFINQYSGAVSLFPPIGDYSTFDSFLSLYGWGGKSKWYCLSMIGYYIIILRILTLLGISLVTRLKQGKHTS
jgi:ABC-type multidrug transport system ATPase subunit